MNMMIDGNTAALNNYEHNYAVAELTQPSTAFLASELCYGEDIDLDLSFDDVIESVINSDDLKKALMAIHRNDLLPMQELMTDCAKRLIEGERS